jgi:hypothetical protein
MSAAVPAAPWRDRSWRRFPALLVAAFSITTLGFFCFARLLDAPPVPPFRRSPSRPSWSS